MGHMSRHLLTAALLSGVVVASHGGQQIPAHIAASAVPDAMPQERRSRKGKGYGARPSGAAAAKRAKAKRRNIAKRPNCNKAVHRFAKRSKRA